jgi:hypothetical protein
MKIQAGGQWMSTSSYAVRDSSTPPRLQYRGPRFMIVP